MAGGTHILKEKPDRVRFFLRLHRAPCEKNSQNQNDDRQECEKPLLFLIFFHWKPLSFLNTIIRDLNLLAQVTDFYFSMYLSFQSQSFKVTSRTVSTPSGRIGFGPRSAKTMSG